MQRGMKCFVTHTFYFIKIYFKNYPYNKILKYFYIQTSKVNFDKYVDTSKYSPSPHN